MSVFPSVVGEVIASGEHSWTSKDALLYAVGVGAGQASDRELAFTTENSIGVGQRVLPTFPVVLVPRLPLERVGDFHLRDVVHAEESLSLHAPLPTEGRARSTVTVESMYDKGSGALVTLATDLRDADSGQPLATVSRGVFLRGQGGFGGDRGPSSGWRPPDRAPDARVDCEIRPEQALVYRLSGDRNPLHSDPTFARQAGFSRPILHGLCTFGHAGRALLQTVCEGDPGRVGLMSARFLTPIYPGDTVSVVVWSDGDRAFFQVRRGDEVALDRGQLHLRAA